MIAKKSIIETGHGDIIVDISYNYYGNRLATCSLDHKVKIFNKVSETGWVKASELSGHSSSIFKVKWAHPEFGNMIATASFDKYVIIWEEKRKIIKRASKETDEPEYEYSWVERNKFCESKEAITDIKFAPSNMGLKLATASADGFVRLYEAPDLMNIGGWLMIGEIKVNQLGIACLSWNKNPFDPPMLAVGCCDRTRNGPQSIARDQNEMGEDPNMPAKGEKDDQCLLSLYYYKENTWTLLSPLENEKTRSLHTINDISWSPLNGRNFHMLSSCDKTGGFIWYFNFEDGANKSKTLTLLNIVKLDISKEVFKCAWNLLGTILATNSSDNIVRLWRNSGESKWVVIEIQEKEVSEEKQRKMLS